MTGTMGPVLLETPQGSYPLRYSLERIPDEPDAQVAVMIAKMCQYACEDARSYPVQYDAQVAVSGDPSNPLGAIHSFVRSRMVFVRDETLGSPFQRLLRNPGTGPGQDQIVEAITRPVDISLQYAGTGQPVKGDCDCFSAYCASLLTALGIPCCFATVAADSDTPQVYSHVYCVAYWRGQRVPMDCSHMAQAGMETQTRYRYQEFPVQDRAAWCGVAIAMLAGGWFLWKYRKQVGELFA